MAFAIMYIEVDSSWRDIVDMLMPGHDWQPYRTNGGIPIYCVMSMVFHDGE